MKLHVFDFDGTLFGSPPPLPGYWRDVGSWWQDPISLSEPCVPLRPDDSWWNGPIVDQARKSISDPDVMAILMTGRQEQNAALRFRVVELLHHAGLNFEYVLLTQSGHNSTMEFKIAALSAILRRHPDIIEVHFWDDRHHHLPHFVATAEDAGIPAFGHPVTRFEREADCTPNELAAMRESKIHQVEPVRVPFKLDVPDDLRQIHQRLGRWGELYVVGGAVRDALLNKVPKDYDLATNLPPDRVIDILRGQMGLRLDLTGKAFGVVRVWTRDKNEYEIATFREDVGAGRRPDAVKFTTIEQDVKRRDLTINALFYDLDKGEIVDYVGGIRDLEDGVVRAVGDPAERFREDALRSLRAPRFAARMGSDLDPETRTAIMQVASQPKLSDETGPTPPERIQDEFVKGLISAKDPRQYVNMLLDLGLDRHVLPGLRVSSHVLNDSLPVQLASMLVGNEPAAVSPVLTQMRFPKAIVNEVPFLLSLSTLTPESAVKMKKDRNRFKVPAEDIRAFAGTTGLDTHLINTFITFSDLPPAVSAKDLMAQGMKGPQIGQGLADAERNAFTQMLSESSLRLLIRNVLTEVS